MGQPCARRCCGRGLFGDACHDRHARRCATGQVGGNARLGGQDRDLRPLSRRPRGDCAADLRRARRDLGAAFDDAGVVAGQGTVGLEIAQDAKALGAGLDFVAVPCSGGGFGKRNCAWSSDVSPQTRVVSVEPEFFDGMRRSLQAGERTAAPAIGVSIANSLMAPMPGRIAFAILKGREFRRIRRY